ncbi:MAG: radical SAM protein [Desulfobacteraceae bacterium]|jgi:radical SAM protein with 4Fe4S-binding SPASM domain
METEHHLIQNPPNYVLWELTLRCNFRCLHCAAGAGVPRKQELSTSEALDLCDQIAALSIPSVALMGGEPLLRPDWGQIAQRLGEHEIQVGIITNGYLFNEKMARLVSDLGIVQVGVSLDAADPKIHDQIRGIKGAHAKAIRAIRIINKMKLAHPTVITSVNKYNLCELSRILNFLLSETQDFLWIINHSSDHHTRSNKEKWTLDIKEYIQMAAFIHNARNQHTGIHISGTHSLGYFSRKFTNLYDDQWSGCGAGITALGIRSNGDVSGCLILPDRFIEDNIKRKKLVDIWNDENAFAYNRQFDPKKLKGNCQGCRWGDICKAGCTNVAYCVSKSIYEYPYCLQHLEIKGTF